MTMTKDGSWRLERTLRSIGSKASQIVIGIDAATRDDTVDRARRYTKHVYTIDNVEGYIEPHIGALFEKCTGDWVLRLDDDEVMSTNFDLKAIPDTVLDEFDLIGFPRAWIVNTDPPFYIGTGAERGQLVPQFRLMKRSAQWSFISTIHTPGFKMKPAYVVPDMFLYHLNLVDKSAEARRRTYDFYQNHLDDRGGHWNRTYLFDPEHLYNTGQGLRCSIEMFPPLDLLRSTEREFQA